MIRPSEWFTSATTFRGGGGPDTTPFSLPPHHYQPSQIHNNNQEPEREITQSDILNQIKRKREQDRKFGRPDRKWDSQPQDGNRKHWESEFEKMKQDFVSSTPFQTRLGGDYFNSSFDDGQSGIPASKWGKRSASMMPDSPSIPTSSKSGTLHMNSLFRVEFDVKEFDPESVRIKLEDGTVLVMEAKQTSHRCTKQFSRRVHVPTGTNTDRLVCRLVLVTGVLIVEVPEPPSYLEACEECKQSMLAAGSEPKIQGGKILDATQTVKSLDDETDADSSITRLQSSSDNNLSTHRSSGSSSNVSDVTTPPATPTPTTLAMVEGTPRTPRITRIKRENSLYGYDNVGPALPVTPGGTQIVREYEVNPGGGDTFPRRTKITREHSEMPPPKSNPTTHVPRHSMSLDSSADPTTNQKSVEIPSITVSTPKSTPTTPRRTQIIREYEQNGDSGISSPSASTPRRTEIVREYKTSTTTQGNPDDSKSSSEILKDYSSATLPTRRSTSVTRDFSPVTTSRYSKVTSSNGKPSRGVSEHAPHLKIERTESTPARPRHTEIIREYTSTPSSPRLTRLIRSSTITEDPSMSPGTLRFSTSSSPVIKPRSSEFITSSGTNSSRRYTPGTMKYTPTPSTKRYTLNHVNRHTPIRTEFDADNFLSNEDTFAYSPITIKYSTLPTKGRQKTHKVLVGRSNSHAMTPESQWRTSSSRNPKISLSDSVDSEATLSSSPSDDLYQGHSSFSDLDL